MYAGSFASHAQILTRRAERNHVHRLHLVAMYPSHAAEVHHLRESGARNRNRIRLHFRSPYRRYPAHLPGKRKPTRSVKQASKRHVTTFPFRLRLCYRRSSNEGLPSRTRLRQTLQVPCFCCDRRMSAPFAEVAQCPVRNLVVYHQHIVGQLRPFGHDLSVRFSAEHRF